MHESDQDRMARIRQEVHAMEEDVGPEVRPSGVSIPNFAKSTVVHVRLSESEFLAVQAAASNTKRSVSDVIRGAVVQSLRRDDEDGAVQD